MLVEEFCLLPGSDECGRRCVDALILPDREKGIAPRGKNVDAQGQKVVLVQTKASRLGMSLMGQTLFSLRLFRERFNPKSVLSVALCTRDDAALRALLEGHPECRVVVIPVGEVKNITAKDDAADQPMRPNTLRPPSRASRKSKSPKSSRATR
jgi:hypothetical protein